MGQGYLDVECFLLVCDIFCMEMEGSPYVTVSRVGENLDEEMEGILLHITIFHFLPSLFL